MELAKRGSASPNACWDLVRAACKGNSEPIPEAYRPFNRDTDDGRDMQTYSRLLADAIRFMVDLKEEKDLNSLFVGPATTALASTIRGLDDFELIAFLVIRRTDPVRATSAKSAPGV